MCLFSFVQLISFSFNFGLNSHKQAKQIDYNQKFEKHLLKLKVITEHYNTIAKQNIKQYKLRSVIRHIVIYNKYYISQLENKIYHMKYIMECNDDKSKLLVLDDQIEYESKKILSDLINIYSKMRYYKL